MRPNPIQGRNLHDPRYEELMKIGFIGTGRMGALMALNLRRAGHDLIVHDARRAAADPVLAEGATWADSPAAVAAAAPVVFASLPTPAIMEEVAVGPGGILEGATRDSTFIDLTTNSPATVRRVGVRLREAGIDFLDAPVSGGVGGARAASLAVLVGGEREIFDRHRPLLETIGRNVFYLGPLGSGNIAKLVNNTLSFAQRAILAEGLVLGVAAGADPGLLLAVIRASSGNSAAVDRIARTVETGSFTPNFTVDLACKDVGLAVALAREMGVPYRFGAIVEQLLLGLSGEGRGQEDTNQLLGRLERATGQVVRTHDAKEESAG